MSGVIFGYLTGRAPNSRQKISYLFYGSLCHFLLPADSVEFRLLPPASVLGCCSPCVWVGDMSVCLGGDVGRAFLETQQRTGRFSCKKRPILGMFRGFSSSLSFRLLPSASASFRSGSMRDHASVLAPCSYACMMMSGEHFRNPDRGQSGFRGKRPILVLFIPFP